MGLDATVYCDCFEKGTLRASPPPDWQVYVDETGQRCSRSECLEISHEFDQWSQHEACEHEGGELVSHWLGNVALVGFLRCQCGRQADRFPIMLEKVIYSGSHCGDFIDAATVRRLAVEVDALSNLACEDPKEDVFIRDFENKMRELVLAALRVQKPIVF